MDAKALINTVTYYCFRCASAKTRHDLMQAVQDETCLYACRACGADEGVWLQPIQGPAAASRKTKRRIFAPLALKRGNPDASTVHRIRRPPLLLCASRS